MDVIDKYCSYIFGYFGCNNRVKLNLTAFDRISSYLIDRNFHLQVLAHQEFCDQDQKFSRWEAWLFWKIWKIDEKQGGGKETSYEYVFALCCTIVHLSENMM